MRARIIFLSESQEQCNYFRCAQQILSAVAIAFGHSFVMRDIVYDRFKQDEIYTMITNSQGVILFGSEDFINQLNSLFGILMGIRQHIWPEGIQVFSRLKNGSTTQTVFMWPLTESESHIEKVAEVARKFAETKQSVLLSVSSKDQRLVNDHNWRWKNELHSPYDILRQILEQEHVKPFVLASFEDVMLFDGILHYLNGTSIIAYTTYMTQSNKYLYRPDLQSGILAMLVLCIQLLRESLCLDKEAECLETAFANALSNTDTPEELTERQKTAETKFLNLIEEQVTLVGELFERFGKE